MDKPKGMIASDVGLRAPEDPAHLLQELSASRISFNG